jgi:hypothetical protein
MASIYQIRGSLLEEVVLLLLARSGYRGVLVGEEGTRNGPAGLEVEGRGAAHQIDALVTPVHAHAFIYPIRLLVEAKCEAKPFGLAVVRSVGGSVFDINQNYFNERQPDGRELQAATCWQGHSRYRAVPEASRLGPMTSPASPSSEGGSKEDYSASINQSVFGSKSGGLLRQYAGAPRKSEEPLGLLMARTQGQAYSLLLLGSIREGLNTLNVQTDEYTSDFDWLVIRSVNRCANHFQEYRRRCGHWPLSRVLHYNIARIHQALRLRGIRCYESRLTRWSSTLSGRF